MPLSFLPLFCRHCRRFARRRGPTWLYGERKRRRKWAFGRAAVFARRKTPPVRTYFVLAYPSRFRRAGHVNGKHAKSSRPDRIKRTACRNRIKKKKKMKRTAKQTFAFRAVLGLECRSCVRPTEAAKNYEKKGKWIRFVIKKKKNRPSNGCHGIKSEYRTTVRRLTAYTLKTLYGSPESLTCDDNNNNIHWPSADRFRSNYNKRWTSVMAQITTEDNLLLGEIGVLMIIIKITNNN